MRESFETCWKESTRQASGTLADSFTIPIAAEIQRFPSGPDTCLDTGPPRPPPSRSLEELSRVLCLCVISTSHMGVKPGVCLRWNSGPVLASKAREQLKKAKCYIFKMSCFLKKQGRLSGVG